LSNTLKYIYLHVNCLAPSFQMHNLDQSHLNAIAFDPMSGSGTNDMFDIDV